MSLARYLAQSRILIDLEATTTRDCILALSAAIATDLGCAEAVISDPLLSREKLGSTAIGKGVALPHAKSAGTQSPVAAAACLAVPLEPSGPDDIPVDLFIAVVLPTEGADLAVLSRIVKDLRDPQLLAALRAARSPRAFFDVVA